MHPSLQGKDKKERRHLEKAPKQATGKASPRTGATAPTKMEDQPPATILRLARSIRQRKGHPQPSRLGISLGEPSNASPVVAVGTTTTVTRPRKQQPAAPIPTAAATPPTRSLARPPAQRLVSVVSPTPAPAAANTARAPATPPLRSPTQKDTAAVPPTWLLPASEETSTPPGSASTPSADPDPAPETPLTGEWMAERVTWSSDIQVQEGRIVHNAATPLRQALWASVMLDIAAQTGMPPAKLLDDADRLFLAVEQCRGTRLRTLRSWHAPYKSKQPGVSAGARRVRHRPSAQPAEQAPATQDTKGPVQPIVQPAAQHDAPATPAPTTQREPLKPLNGGGEDGVDDEPVLPMLARKCALRATRRMAGAHNGLSSTA